MNLPPVAEIAKCPVCKLTDYLYQISYPGSKEYVPPRCNDCYEKMMLRRMERRMNPRHLQEKTPGVI
jgi:hypothetical protein